MSIIDVASAYAIPAIFVVIIVYGINNDLLVYDVFTEGAKEGISTIIKIIPPLVGLMVAVGVFRASGALDLLIYLLSPLTSVLKIPPEALTLAIVRPISGSASLAVVSDVMNAYGADSFIGMLVCTMMGSTETIFYTLAVYLGAVGITKVRYTLVAVIIADIVGLIVSVWACKMALGV